MEDIYGHDAYAPDEIAERVERVGVAKARLPVIKLVALGVLAGGFIGLGAMFYTIVAADPHLSFAVERVLGGVVFSLGLILVVVAGAELFTGNNLMVMSWVNCRISSGLLMRNLCLVYVANMYFVPLGIFLGGEDVTWGAFVTNNLIPVTMGNIVGGAGMVGLVYHVIYGREGHGEEE